MVYLCQVLATSARVLYLGSALLEGKKTAAKILHKNERAVRGRSSKKVYFLGNATDTTMYDAGAFTFSFTYWLRKRKKGGTLAFVRPATA